MVFNVPSNCQEFELVVKVRTTSPQVLRVILRDSKLPNTQYTNRYKTVDGDYTFFIKCPVSGEMSELIIYNDTIGDIPALSDATFSVIKPLHKGIYMRPLEKRMDIIDWTNWEVRTFVKFATAFAYNAGYLAPNRAYYSDHDVFIIEYLPTIVDEATGQVVNTSSRISKDTGIIQVSQQKFLDMTFPMRMAILLHEFSHCYRNEDMDNEVEADLNALIIYLGLGYPRIEAHDAWLGAFIGAATEQNEQRYRIIKDFIDEFDRDKAIIHY